MVLYRFDQATARPITQYGSHGVSITQILQEPASAHLALMYLQPGGEVGRHPAVGEQLFLVIEGEGWVQGEDGLRQPIGTGQAALWSSGEQHASETITGMVALVVEGVEIANALKLEGENEP